MNVHHNQNYAISFDYIQSENIYVNCIPKVMYTFREVTRMDKGIWIKLNAMGCWYKDFGARSRYIRYGYVIASHWIQWLIPAWDTCFWHQSPHITPKNTAKPLNYSMAYTLYAIQATSQTFIHRSFNKKTGCVFDRKYKSIFRDMKLHGLCEQHLQLPSKAVGDSHLVWQMGSNCLLTHLNNTHAIDYYRCARVRGHAYPFPRPKLLILRYRHIFPHLVYGYHRLFHLVIPWFTASNRMWFIVV